MQFYFGRLRRQRHSFGKLAVPVVCPCYNCSFVPPTRLSQEVENYEYELPSDFEDEEIDEELAFTEEDKKKYGSWFEREVSADGDDDGDAGAFDVDEEYNTDDFSEDDDAADGAKGGRKGPGQSKAAAAEADSDDPGEEDDDDDLPFEDDDDDEDNELEDLGEDDSADEEAHRCEERHGGEAGDRGGGHGCAGARMRAPILP